MNDGIKQRLVGAIVLISAAIIAWPLIFSNTNEPVMDRRSQIPPMPEFETFEVTEPVRPQNVDPVKERLVESSPPTPPLPVESDNKPSLDESGLPNSWVLQVASFSKKENAGELVAALKEKGYRAFSKEVKTSTGSSLRVYIGPKLTRDAFAKDKQIIDNEFNVSSMVVKFEQ